MKKSYKSLHKLGATTVTLHDKEGRPFDARIAMEAFSRGSPRSCLHLFAEDETGRERIHSNQWIPIEMIYVVLRKKGDKEPIIAERSQLPDKKLV